MVNFSVSKAKGTIRRYERFSGAVCKHLASRKRDRKVLDLNRMRRHIHDDYGVNISPDEFVVFWRDLELSGAGRFDERAKPTDTDRFEFQVSPIEFGKLMLGKKSTLEVTTPVAKTGPEDVRVQYPLRKNCVVDLVFPPDLTKQEANDLADFIRRLAR